MHVTITIVNFIPGEDTTVALLRQLRPVRVLSSRTHDKFIALLAQHSSKPGDGILMLEKSPFPLDWPVELTDWIHSANSVAHNDIYHKLSVIPTENSGFAHLKVTVIFPASEKQIKKFETQNAHILSETKAAFDAVVQPHVEVKPILVVIYLCRNL